MRRAGDRDVGRINGTGLKSRKKQEAFYLLNVTIGSAAGYLGCLKYFKIRVKLQRLIRMLMRQKGMNPGCLPTCNKFRDVFFPQRVGNVLKSGRHSPGKLRLSACSSLCYLLVLIINKNLPGIRKNHEVD